MTVKELRRLLTGLPPTMNVVLQAGEETLITACYEKSGLVKIDIIDEFDEDKFETTEVLLLLPCGCPEDHNLLDKEINLN